LPLELGSSGKKAAPSSDARAGRLYALICEEVRAMKLADRFRVFAAFKRGDDFDDLDPVVADAFRSVAQKL